MPWKPGCDARPSLLQTLPHAGCLPAETTPPTPTPLCLWSSQSVIRAVDSCTLTHGARLLSSLAESLSIRRLAYSSKVPRAPLCPKARTRGAIEAIIIPNQPVLSRCSKRMMANACKRLPVASCTNLVSSALTDFSLTQQLCGTSRNSVRSFQGVAKSSAWNWATPSVHALLSACTCTLPMPLCWQSAYGLCACDTALSKLCCATRAFSFIFFLMGGRLTEISKPCLPQ